MKKTVLPITVTIVLSIASQLLMATVWRVNNRANASADFTIIQQAHNSVSSGDTLYIEGSPIPYGDLICTKQLFLIGPGNFLNENDSTQEYKETATLGNVQFNTGSEFSVIEGFLFYNSKVIIKTSNITVKKNRFNTISNESWIHFYGIIIDNDNCNDILIENNWIYLHASNQYSSNRAIYSSHSNLSNLVIRNNYIHARINSYFSSTCYSVYLPNTVLPENVTIYQNVIHSGITETGESQFYNNIMISGTFIPGGAFYNNNIGNSTQFGNDNGNQSNVDMNLVFIDYTNGIDNGMMLKQGSPALNAGLFGEDCGMYGGDHPYVLSCMPSIPAIWEATLNNFGNNNISIDINIKAKSNN